jgi:hypothetical protein
MSLVLNAWIAQPCLSCASRGKVSWSGFPAAVQRADPTVSGAVLRRESRDGCLSRRLRTGFARWGIEISIIVPGAFTGDTNHFAHAGSPDDKSRAAEYEAGPYAGFAEQVLKGFASIVPPDAAVSAVAEAMVKVVEAPFGKRPFRVHIDPTQDGAEVVNAVSDRVRAELLRRIGLADLLSPRVLASQSESGD